jgi:DNA repair photolyase
MRSTTQLPLLDTTAPRPLPVIDAQLQRGTTFHEVPVKAILNSPTTTNMGFWSLNPYIGCEFGCTYCYARETHRWAVERSGGRSEASRQTQAEAANSGESLTADETTAPAARPPATDLPAWLAFEKRILVKTSAAAVLTRTLFPAKLANSTLVIGTATDPYQPAERRFQLTRSILQALLGWRGLKLGIITKSPLILRDLALLQELSQRHELSIHISIASVDAALLRRLEARSPAPHARIRALKGLVDGGIRAGIMMAPIVPGISDSREQLAAVMQAGKDAGAHYVHGAALRLGPAARARFLPHLAHEFPEMLGRYTRRYARGDSPGKDYTDALTARLRSLQREYGFEPTTPRAERMREQRAAAQSEDVQEELL